MKDILKYQNNKNLSVYKIALNLKKCIDKSQKETFLLKIVSTLSKIVDIPANIISYEIKQIMALSGNFSFSEGKFSKRFSPRYIILDGLYYLCCLGFVTIFSKKIFKCETVNLIVDDVQFTSQVDLFYRLTKSADKSAYICRKKIDFGKENIKKFNIKFFPIIKFYNSNFLKGKKLPLFNLFFLILLQSLKYRINLFFVFTKILYKVVNYETIFSQINSKVLIIDRFHRTSAIKDFIFKRHGGIRTCCVQRNICEFTISFFIHIDIFFCLGPNKPLLIRKLGGKIKKFVPVGSLFMEKWWYNEKKYLSKIPASDILVLGLNYANSPERMYMDKYHYDNYYNHIRWIKKISNIFPNLKVIIKHHDNCRVDPIEKKILKYSNVKTIYKSIGSNLSYSYLYKANQIFSFGSTMVLEGLSINKPCYFLDPNLQNLSFFKSITNSKKIRIKNFSEFKKIVGKNLKKRKKNNIKNPSSFCLKSNITSKRIINYLENQNIF